MQHSEFATLEFAPERPPADGDADEEAGEGELLMDERGNTREELRTLYRKHEFVFPRDDENCEPWRGPKPNPADSNQILAFGLIVHMEGSRLFVFTSSDGQSHHEIREFRAPYAPTQSVDTYLGCWLRLKLSNNQEAKIVEVPETMRMALQTKVYKRRDIPKHFEFLLYDNVRARRTGGYSPLLGLIDDPDRRIDLYRQWHPDVGNDCVYNVEYVIWPEMRDGRCVVSTRIVRVHGSIDHRVDLPKELSWRPDESIQSLDQKHFVNRLLHSPEELAAKEEERKQRRRDQDIAFSQRYLNMGNFQQQPAAPAVRDAPAAPPPAAAPIARVLVRAASPVYSDAEESDASLPPTPQRSPAVPSPAFKPVAFGSAAYASAQATRVQEVRGQPTAKQNGCQPHARPAATARQSPHASSQRNGFQQPPPPQQQQQPSASTTAPADDCGEFEMREGLRIVSNSPDLDIRRAVQQTLAPQKTQQQHKNKSATIFITYSTNGYGVLLAKQYLRDGYNVVVHADDANADEAKIRERFPNDLIKDHNFMMVKGYLSETFAVTVVNGVLGKFHRLDAILHIGCALCKPGRVECERDNVDYLFRENVRP
ncbi:hypothetical protein M3Y99_01364700 [Aphelenchoides fujianensis]|nr:hypothetical protein M3Y99_01364700 [Aphelenchoides fujianensis]